MSLIRLLLIGIAALYAVYLTVGLVRGTTSRLEAKQAYLIAFIGVGGAIMAAGALWWPWPIPPAVVDIGVVLLFVAAALYGVLEVTKTKSHIQDTVRRARGIRDTVRRTRDDRQGSRTYENETDDRLHQ
jgi:hypothetical protein